MPIALPAGQTRRQASNTSSGKRRRLSAVPPYSSLRWLLRGDRNWLQEIAVRAVQLDDVEAQPRAAQGGLDEGLLDPLQADRIEGDRRVPLGVVGDGRGRDGGPRQVGRIGLGERAAALPRPLRRGLAAGMGELDAELDRGHPGARPVDDRT